MFVVQSRGYWYPCFLLEKSIFSPLSGRLFAIAGCPGFAAGRPLLQEFFFEQCYQLRERLAAVAARVLFVGAQFGGGQDRKSTRLNSSHVKISYAVFCLK